MTVCLFVQIPPMMMNLFPGSTVAQVLSSAKGQSLQDELTETIRVWESSSDPEKRLAELPPTAKTSKRLTSGLVIDYSDDLSIILMPNYLF